jgi:ribosomal protein L5
LKEFTTNFRNKVLLISIPNLFAFKEIEKDYEHFPDLPKLNISLVFKANNRKELVDLLSALHFPLKKKD